MSHLNTSAQIKRFLITGVSATLIDLAAYSAMLAAGLDFTPAKVCGFFAAVLFAYYGHRSWTFKSHGSKKRFTGFMVLYTIALVINTSTNAGVLRLFGIGSGSNTGLLNILQDNPAMLIGIGTAFVVATGLTATMNFIAMKFFIFRPKKALPPDTDDEFSDFLLEEGSGE